jgi:hypothetical protein
MPKKLKVIGDGLRLRQDPSYEGKVISKLKKETIVEFLKNSEDNEWVNVITPTGQTGWCHTKYLTEQTKQVKDDIYSQIFDVVNTSAITNYFWKDRGRTKIGFYKGIALVFARVYCKLKAGDTAAKEMAKAATGNSNKDALTYYADKFAEYGMVNEVDGTSTLRHLFVFMVGLAMRESSGKYCEGRDKSAENFDGDTAEAGLFQTSYNARKAHILLPKIFEYYKDNPDGFVEVFKEGFTPCSLEDLKNHGTGDGKDFQKLSKESPAFAAEFTAIALRNKRDHWGPINNKHVEIKPECNIMFLKVQQVLELNDIKEI